MIDLRKKKILITGAHGFLGKHLANNLLKKRRVPRRNLFLPTSKELDLRKMRNAKEAVAKVDIVIHLAGRVGGIGFNQDVPGELFYDNLIMGVFLMEAARKKTVEKFVSIGTICSYPKITPVPFKEQNLWNGYPEETNAPYGLAKKMLLVQGQAYRKQYNLNSIHLLLVNMYGPGDNFDPKSSHVIPALIKKVADAKKNKSEFIEVWGTGRATREFLYVEDAAEGIALATERYEKTNPINLGASSEISIKKLVKLIVDLMKYTGEVRWDKSKPDGQPRRRLDVTKAKKEFGFTAKTNFKNGLKREIDWFYKNFK